MSSKTFGLVDEHVAEFRYRPGNCSREYRVVVVWKDLDVYRGQGRLFDYDCCFFYITNDFDSPAEQIVYSANQRCNQENTIEQHKNGVHVLTVPLDTLDSNWAYMIMASLAWSLKAWSALLVPVSPRWQAMHDALKQRLLRMDFATYRHAIINIPAQIVAHRRQDCVSPVSLELMAGYVFSLDRSNRGAQRWLAVRHHVGVWMLRPAAALFRLRPESKPL